MFEEVLELQSHYCLAGASNSFGRGAPGKLVSVDMSQVPNSVVNIPRAVECCTAILDLGR